MSIERLSIESKQELEEMISKELNRIEEDLTVVCSHVPINDTSTLDILCHDENGQLAIIQLSTSEDDLMLIQGLQSIDYVNKFKSFLKATYNKHKIDDKEKPRLILVAPSFSNAIRNAAESMTGMRIDLYEWEYLKLGDQKGISFQNVFGSKSSVKPREMKEPEKKRETRSRKKEEPTTENQEPLPPTPEETTEQVQTEEPAPPEETQEKRKYRLF